MGAVELVADRLQLTPLELADLDPPPAIRGPDDGGVHQLQDRPLAEGVRDDLRPPVFFDALPTDPPNGGPWVMWKSTKYAHVMVPTTSMPKPAATKSSAKPATK